MKFSIPFLSFRKKARILFFGTPEYSALILKHMIDARLKPVAVVTRPDKPTGRKQELTSSPVKLVAQATRIPVVQPESLKDNADWIKNINQIKPDLIVLAAYGLIIPQEILSIPPKGSLNVHPSLLPKYRGATPIQTAILNGDKQTGVTIFVMDGQVDHGPIVTQAKLDISETENAEQLTLKLAELGGQIVSLAIPKYLSGELTAKPQDDAAATTTNKITKESGLLDWHLEAATLVRHVRAFYPWPGSSTVIKQSADSGLEGKALKIIQATAGENYSRARGEVFVDRHGEISVSCENGSLVLEKIQVEGGKPMFTSEFVQGHEFVGSILGN